MVGAFQRLRGTPLCNMVPRGRTDLHQQQTNNLGLVLQKYVVGTLTLPVVSTSMESKFARKGLIFDSQKCRFTQPQPFRIMHGKVCDTKAFIGQVRQQHPPNTRAQCDT